MVEKKYGKYNVTFEDSQDEQGDHAFAEVVFPGDVDVPEEILKQMTVDADSCGELHDWELTETHQYYDELCHFETGYYNLDEPIAKTVYNMHRNT